MENAIISRANEFLKELSDSELKELVFCNSLSEFPANHIMRKLVKYTYQDCKVGFAMGMMSMYPFIAQELHKRYKELQIRCDALRHQMNSFYGDAKLDGFSFIRDENE